MKVAFPPPNTKPKQQEAFEQKNVSRFISINGFNPSSQINFTFTAESSIFLVTCDSKCED